MRFDKPCTLFLVLKCAQTPVSDCWPYVTTSISLFERFKDTVPAKVCVILESNDEHESAGPPVYKSWSNVAFVVFGGLRVRRITADVSRNLRFPRLQSSNRCQRKIRASAISPALNGKSAWRRKAQITDVSVRVHSSTSSRCHLKL